MSAGDLDPTFGVGGKVLAETVGFPVADLAVQPNGKIVVVGKLNNDFAVARLNANGTIDKSFGRFRQTSITHSISATPRPSACSTTTR